MARLLLAALALAAPACAAVVELSAGSFDAFLATTPRAIVLEFYAPWCAHCQQYAPHFARAADEGAALAAWARVDGARHYSLGLRFGVAGFPTLFYLGAPPAAGGGAREVRRLALTAHGHEGVLDYARGGWRQQPVEGADWWRGPWGPLARAKFGAARAYEAAAAALEAPAEALGAPPVAVQFTLILGILCALTHAVIACAVCSGARKRAARR
jgi:thiol-disulfide isomerase/thioredoxin